MVAIRVVRKCFVLSKSDEICNLSDTIERMSEMENRILDQITSSFPSSHSLVHRSSNQRLSEKATFFTRGMFASFLLLFFFPCLEKLKKL